MSRHEGVSCDSCMKGNFRGRRFKCLVCYDYDLCSSCYEAGVSTTRHATSHPMQCILTRSDNDLYFGGEAALATEHQNSFTCPFCSKMGYTEITLQEHVASLHGDASQEVVCPICASFPGGDPNHLTEDFQGHLNLEHRAGAGGARDLISFLDEPGGGGGVHRQGAVRRIAHSRGGLASHRTRRHNAAPSSGPLGPSTLSSLSPATREAVDPIAELLSQLSGVRRAGSSSSSSSQLHQLQMELQLQRQQAQAHRQTLERLTRRPAGGGPTATMSAPAQPASTSSGLAALQAPPAAASTSTSSQSKDTNKNGAAGFLLATLEAEESSEEEEEQQAAAAAANAAAAQQQLEQAVRSRADRDKEKRIFIQELLLSALSLQEQDSHLS